MKIAKISFQWRKREVIVGDWFGQYKTHRGSHKEALWETVSRITGYEIIQIRDAGFAGNRKVLLMDRSGEFIQVDAYHSNIGTFSMSIPGIRFEELRGIEIEKREVA